MTARDQRLKAPRDAGGLQGGITATDGHTTPGSWRVARFGELCKLEYGAALKAEARRGGSTPVYGSGGIIGYHDRALVKGPGAVLGRKGNVGSTAWSEVDFWPIDTTFYARPIRDDVNLRWLYFALEATDFRSASVASGVPGLNRVDALERRVKVPPLAVQERIVRILRTFDDAIKSGLAVARQQIDVKHGLVVELMTRGLDSRNHFRDPPPNEPTARESVFDRMPEDWRMVRVDQAGETRLGRGRSPRKLTDRHSTPYLRVANVFDGWIDCSDLMEMDFDERERAIYGLQPGDVLLNEGQSIDLVGRSALFHGEPGKYCFQNSLIRFRCGPECLPIFAQAVFKWKLLTGQFRRVALQTTSIAHLGSDRFASMRFPLPPMAEQKRIVRVLTRADRAIETAREHVTRLQLDRDAIAEQLLNGELTARA